MGKLKALLVGTGGWAEAHAKAYALCDEVELVAVCGHRNVERLNHIADTYGGVARGLDVAELASAIQPDILDIACNPHCRLDAIEQAVVPSLKLVNVEKPLALTPGEAYAIESFCRERNLLLTVNHQKKFLPAWRKVRGLIDEGVLGEVRFFRATCQGNLLEQGTHLVDMVMFYADYAPLDWAMGQVGDLDGLDKPQASAPDAAIASLAFANGTRAFLELGTVGRNLPEETNKWQQFAVTAYGDRGHAEVTLNKTLRVTTYEDGRTVTEPSRWDDEFINAQVVHLDETALYARDPARGHISSLGRSMASFDAVMAILSSACGGGRVPLQQRFEDSIMDRLSALRSR